MPLPANNVVPFPGRRRHTLNACPQCGTHTSLWRIGRLLWGYCDDHEVRWVAADLRVSPPGTIDLPQLRQRLEWLSGFAEVSP